MWENFICGQTLLHNLKMADTVNYILNNIFLTYKRTEVAGYPDKKKPHMCIFFAGRAIQLK